MYRSGLLVHSLGHECRETRTSISSNFGKVTPHDCLPQVSLKEHLEDIFTTKAWLTWIRKRPRLLPWKADTTRWLRRHRLEFLFAACSTSGGAPGTRKVNMNTTAPTRNHVNRMIRELPRRINLSRLNPRLLEKQIVGFPIFACLLQQGRPKTNSTLHV